MTEIKVMLLTHLPHVRRFVQDALGSDSSFSIVSVAINLMQAYSEAEERKPRLALVSADFTRLAEFEMMRALFSALDVRWIVLTHEKAGSKADETVAKKNFGIFSVDVSEGTSALLQTLRTLTRSPQAAHRLRTPENRTSPGTRVSSLSNRVVLIGSSTGGIDALTEVLLRFPEDCPPTFIVQHTGSSFGDSLVRLLNGRCAASVVAARDATEIGTGMVCVGAGLDAHVRVAKGAALSCRLKTAPPVSGHIPSVDELFKSALPFAKQVIACLLTGMGRDGAAGLLELKKAGARTFVQDEGSSVVYGMPKAAWEMGAAEKRVPITRMADTIFEACGQSVKRNSEIGI